MSATCTYFACNGIVGTTSGCDYWNDERMKFLINGTQSTVHDFDGCMYGLKSQFKDVGTAIKKPWRIVSWGLSSLTCM